jgi:hypothetical protein
MIIPDEWLYVSVGRDAEKDTCFRILQKDFNILADFNGIYNYFRILCDMWKVYVGENFISLSQAQLDIGMSPADWWTDVTYTRIIFHYTKAGSLSERMALDETQRMFKNTSLSNALNKKYGPQRLLRDIRNISEF